MHQRMLKQSGEFHWTQINFFALKLLFGTTFIGFEKFVEV